MKKTCKTIVNKYDQLYRVARKNVTRITLNYKDMNAWVKVLFIAFDRKILQVLFATKMIFIKTF